MEEQLKQHLEEIVGLLKEGGQFALEQAPDFIHEYLTYYAWFHGFWMVFGLILSVAIGYVFIRIIKERDYLNTVDRTFVGVMVSVIGFVPIVVFLTNAFSFLKIMVAPRLYLIENLLGLVK